jgi:hypothetical protein
MLDAQEGFKCEFLFDAKQKTHTMLFGIKLF